jgi:hypothetical protein
MAKRHVHVRQVEYGEETGEDVSRDLLQILYGHLDCVSTPPPAAEVTRAEL